MLAPIPKNCERATCHPEAGEARRRTSQTQVALRSNRFALHGGVTVEHAGSWLRNLRAIVRSFAVYAAQDDTLSCPSSKFLNASGLFTGALQVKFSQT